MIKPEQIPPDAMYAAWKAMNAGMTLNDAIAAAINARPGMAQKTTAVGLDVKRGKVVMDPHIILTLPKEPEA